MNLKEVLATGLFGVLFAVALSTEYALRAIPFSVAYAWISHTAPFLTIRSFFLLLIGLTLLASLVITLRKSKGPNRYSIVSDYLKCLLIGLCFLGQFRGPELCYGEGVERSLFIRSDLLVLSICLLGNLALNALRIHSIKTWCLCRNIFVCILLLYICVSILADVDQLVGYTFKGVLRADGVSESPNVFGALCAVCVLAIIGVMLRETRFLREPHLISLIGWSAALAVVLMLLISSFSRSAWLGVSVSLMLYLIIVRSEFYGLRRFVIFLSLLVLCLNAAGALYFFRDSSSGISPVVDRVISVSNIQEASIKNRLRAAQGGVKMIADRPLLGFGISGYRPAYDFLYKSDDVLEIGAIETNDLQKIAIVLGFPALVIFLLLAFECLMKRNYDCESVMYVVIVLCLLIVFFFSGGLFRISLCSVFWISLDFAKRSD